jgi:hypothetical protein
MIRRREGYLICSLRQRTYQAATRHLKACDFFVTAEAESRTAIKAGEAFVAVLAPRDPSRMVSTVCARMAAIRCRR